MSQVPSRHTLILDCDGVSIVSDLPQECLGCLDACPANEVTKGCGSPGKRRRGKIANANGVVFLCTNDGDLVSSSRLFKREMDFLAMCLVRLAEVKSEIAKKEAHKTRRLFHNLISLNAHALQDLYAIVSQEQLSVITGYRSKREYLVTLLSRSPQAVAEIYLRSLKNAGAVKNELAVFQKLYEASPVLKFGKHQVDKVLLNVANYFFQDLADQQINLIIDSSDAKLHLDYESFQVALYHVLDNSVKYALPSSDMRVSFRFDEDFRICLDMTSLYLEPDDQAKIFQDGFSGGQAKSLSKSGQGLGMGLVTELLALNGGALDIHWGNAVPLAFGMPSDAPRYARNQFVIRFPGKLVVQSQ